MYHSLVVDCKHLVLPFKQARVTFLPKWADYVVSWYGPLAPPNCTLLSLLCFNHSCCKDVVQKVFYRKSPKNLNILFKCIMVNILNVIYYGYVIYSLFPKIVKNFAYQGWVQWLRQAILVT
jgi:hypothetical protein